MSTHWLTWIHSTPEPEPEMEDYLNPSLYKLATWLVCYVTKHTEAETKYHRFTDPIFSNLFSCMKIVLFCFKFQWYLFPRTNNNPTMAQIMVWRWTGHRPLSETIPGTSKSIMLFFYFWSLIMNNNCLNRGLMLSNINTFRFSVNSRTCIWYHRLYNTYGRIMSVIAMTS